MIRVFIVLLGYWMWMDLEVVGWGGPYPSREKTKTINKFNALVSSWLSSSQYTSVSQNKGKPSRFACAFDIALVIAHCLCVFHYSCPRPFCHCPCRFMPLLLAHPLPLSLLL